MPPSEEDFRMELPNLTMEELTDKVKGALKDFVANLHVDVTEYNKWVVEVSPQIANYVAMALVDPVKSQQELGVIYAIAKAKAARLAMSAVGQSEETFANYAILIARTLVRIFL